MGVSVNIYLKKKVSVMFTKFCVLLICYTVVPKLFTSYLHFLTVAFTKTLIRFWKKAKCIKP